MKHKFLVPIVTPFNADESVNYSALRALVRCHFENGADGIYASGSSAECFLLSEEERKRTLETVIEAADGGYVVAHVGAIGTRLALDFARHAKEVGASAISSVPPFYYGYDFEGVLEYYRALASVGLPLIVYSAPSMTRDMSIDEYRRLLSIDGIVGMKYTDTNCYKMERVIAATGADIYSGKDENFLAALSMGARGAIGTTFNYMLDKYRAIYTHYRNGENQAARAIQQDANAVADTAAAYCIPAAKYLIKLRYGIDCGGARSPFTPMPKEFEATLESLAAKYL